jgi:Large polyvalent protein associated domain 38
MALKTIYLEGFGLMDVPAELTGKELSVYASREARKRRAEESAAEVAQQAQKKPEPSTMQQAAGFAAGLPAGLASGLIGSTLEGIGGLTGIRPVEEAGASFNEWVQEKLKQAVGEEAAASGASQVGQTIGGIASFFTPGVAAKVLGGAGKLAKVAPYLSIAMSGIQGAGEQVERMRQQEAQGEQIDPLMRQLYAAGAGAGTALLENIPISGLAKYTPLKRVLGDIPVSAEAGAFTRAMDAGAGTILGRALGTGAGEAATEVSQNALQNIIERQYNEQRGILEGSTESAVGGFLAGAALQGGADLYRDVYLNRKKFEGDVKALRGQLSEEQLPLLPAGKRKAVQIRGKDISTVLGEEDIAEAEAAFSKVASPQGVPLLPPGKFASDEEARRKIDEEIEAAKVYGPTPDLSYATPEAMARIEELRAKEQADNEAIIKQREQDIAALPDFPSYLPDPNVTPISEWPKPQVKLFDQYLSKFSPEQAKLIESFSPEEMDSFIERGVKRKTESEQQLQKIREEQAARIAASRRADIEQADAITLSRFAEDYQKQEAEAARAKREEELSKAAAGRAEEAAIKNLYAREEFDKFVADRIAAKSKIEESQRVAGELAKTKFGKPLGELKDSQKIQLASEIDAISKEASFRTEVNKEIPELGDPIYKLQNRVSVNFFGTQYKNLPEAKQGIVNSAIERGEGRTVLGEELLEERDFDKYKRLYNRDDFRAVNKEMRSFVRDESGFIPVTKDSLYSAVKSVSEDPTSTIKPNRMASNAMFKHMLDRGVIVDIDGKTYLNEEATGPRYQLPVSNNPNIESQQSAFKAEEAKVTVGPKMRDALERRGLSDVFTLGIVEKIEDTPALGKYLNRVIQIAAAPEGKVRSIDEMISSMDHEIVHGMRAAGLFTDAEWNLLTTDFNANLLDDKQKEAYTRIYKAQGMSDQAIQEALNEEAVAMKAAQLNNVDPKRLDPKSLSLINKVRFYLEFGRNSAALGYNSAEDVLAAIKSGEIGKRGFTSEFEKVGGKAKRVGRQEISIASEADKSSGVETKVYGEEDEEGITDEKYKQALSGLASKFDRKTPVKSPRQYLIQEMDVAPEDVDSLVKGMIKNKDLVKVGGALYISDRARKGISENPPTESSSPMYEIPRAGEVQSETADKSREFLLDKEQMKNATPEQRAMISSDINRWINARGSSLYHFTSPSSALKIIDSGMIKEGSGVGISLARVPTIFSEGLSPSDSPVAFVVDGRLIESRPFVEGFYTGAKVQYSGGIPRVVGKKGPSISYETTWPKSKSYFEFEQRTIGKNKSLIPSSSIVGIMYDPNYMTDQQVEQIREAATKRGIPVKEYATGAGGTKKSGRTVSRAKVSKAEAGSPLFQLPGVSNERAKQDVLFNPQGPSATKPFFTKKSAKNPLEEASDLIKGNFSSFRQKLIDRYDPVRLMAIEAYSKTGDKKYLSAAEGSYHALLFSDKAQDMALAGLENGGFTTEGSIILAADNEKIAPLKIFQSLREKGKLDAFFNFAYAKRYKALKENGKDPGGVISEADVEREYKRWENDNDINTAIDNFKAYNDNLVDMLRKSGFISAGEAKAWKSAFYIPFYRIPTVMEGDVDTGEVDIPRLSSQITNLSNPKGLTGRDLPVNDAIENVIANTYYVIGTAAKNFAARKVARDGVITGYMKEIEKPGDAQQGYKVITVREGGIKKHYEVKDALLHDAVAKSGFPVQDVLRGMGWFTEKLRRGTTLSPTFIVRNTLRDAIQSWILGQYGSTFLPPFKEITKGIQMAYQNSPEFKALKSAGISSSGLRKKTLQETAKEMRRKIGEEQQGVLAQIGEIFNKGIEVLERGSEISEASTRTKVYQDVLAKTGDRAEALFAAMETINFSRKGSSRGLQIGMALLPFFNARIQGMDVFYRTMKGEKMMPNQMSADMKKAATLRFGYFVGLSMLYAAYMANHPAWENATDEEKDGNIFLPVDFIPGIKEGTVLKFPIPQELGLVAKMPAERIVTMIKGRSDGGELIDALQRAVFDTLSFNPIPQVFLPGIEAIANFDFYSQRPIVNQYLASLLPEEQFTEYSTGVAKAAGRAMEETAFPVSPVMVDHLIRGYFGTIGAYSADILGRLIEEGSDAPVPERMRFSEPYLLPVIGPLFKSAEGKKMVEDLYMIDEAAKMAASTLKAYSENGRELSEAKEDELYQLAEIGEEVRPVIEQIRELNRQKRAIQSDTEMSSSEKRDELNEIQKEIVSLAAEVNDLKKQIPIRLRK